MSFAARSRIILEPTAREFAAATAAPPFLFDFGPTGARHVLDELQSGNFDVPDVRIEDIAIPGGPRGEVSVRILRPLGQSKRLPVVLYIHGGGWVTGNTHTHDRLIREITAETGAALVFPSYSLSPEAPYPTAIEETYAVLCWIADHGAEVGLDGARIAIAGDSVGANVGIALTMVTKQRSGPKLEAQALFYPVTNADFETDSYREFAEGYFLRRDAMSWFWNQYTADEDERAEITASPLRATAEQLTGLPRALVITAEADVVRDEGEAYARKLRRAGVDVTSTRYGATIHDFVMLNALHKTNASQAAIAQAVAFLRRALVQ